MPRITYDGQCFSIDNHRIWIVGAGIDYARIPAELWAERIAAVKQAGFNTVVTPCPWLVHEPRKGRFHFTGDADVKQFVQLCIDAGLYIGIKAGPYVGGTYDGGGLPSWMRDMPEIGLREASDPYLERVGIYLRKLMGQLAPLQATKVTGGGIIFIQAEQSWRCTNDEVAEKYLGDLTRHIRENGINVPVTGANDLWAEAKDTIETWTGSTHLLANLRQFREIHPSNPRLVSGLEPESVATWGDKNPSEDNSELLLTRISQVLAAGAQPIIAPFHGGTNFGFLGGRIAGRNDAFVTTTAAYAAALGEAGLRSNKFARIKRIATFANHFGHVFSELDPDYHPVTVSMDYLLESGTSGKSSKARAGVGVVPLRGARGRVVFVFGDPRAKNQETTLLLDHGLPLTVHLGDQSVGWFLIDVDLGGKAYLNHANLCPFAFVDNSILVMFGQEKTTGHISLNESTVELSVPSGLKPRVVQHENITIVVCSQAQIDATYIDDKCVYVGASGLDTEGKPIATEGFSQVTLIAADKQPEAVKLQGSSKTASATKLESWFASPAETQTLGTNPRYATLSGPETLDACGTPSGYGWYRVNVSVSSTKKRLCALPDIGNRLHLFVDGESQGIMGTGPGAEGYIFELKLTKGEHTIVGLADHTGRFSEGNDFGRRKGWFGHLYEIKALKVNKPKIEEKVPVDPFTVKPFILGQSKGRLMSERQAIWSFTHRKKTPILIDVNEVMSPGVFLLNNEPLTWFAGNLGETTMRLLIDPQMETFKRGVNELSFATDPDCPDGSEEMIAGLTLYEATDNLTKSGSWGFARWEPPQDSAFKEVEKAELKTIKGQACWWRCRFKVRVTELPKWLNTEGLSKGQVFLNGHDVGRYFTSTAVGKKVGPQTKLYLPEPWFKAEEENELIVFDEHGFDPSRTRIEYRTDGDFS